MIATFKQIRFDKDISEKENFGIRILTSLTIVGFGVFLGKADIFPPIVVALIVIILLAFRGIVERKLFSTWVRKNDIIGDLVFDDSSISWSYDNQTRKTHYNDIVSIHLRYNYIQGRTLSSRDFIHNGISQLIFRTIKGNTETVQFVIEREDQIQTLKPIWKSLYIMGIKIREVMCEVQIKTILFESGRSYEQIKQLKKELNVDSFY